jgi:hypothetical protein
MEHHWESGLSVLVRHALAPKVVEEVVVVGMVVVVVGLVDEANSVDTKILASY